MKDFLFMFGLWCIGRVDPLLEAELLTRMSDSMYRKLNVTSHHVRELAKETSEAHKAGVQYGADMVREIIGKGGKVDTFYKNHGLVLQDEK